MNTEKKSKTILLIEDEQLQIEVMLDKLRKKLNVLLATNGKEGLEIAKKRKPDIVILDIFLPGMKGDQVLKKLKSSDRTKDIPVIILTHLEREDIRKKIKEIADVDYLLKENYSAEEIVKKIEAKLQDN